MKKFLLLFAFPLVLVSCSKDEDLVFNNLEGKRFRANAHFDVHKGQAYYTYEFKKKGTFVYNLKWESGSPVNSEYEQSFRWEKKPDTMDGVTLYINDKYNPHLGEQIISGVATKSDLTFDKKFGSLIYEKY